MPRTAMHSRRSHPSCSVIALATVLAVGATPAAAQSFNGSGSFVSGSGSISTGAGTTTIDLTSQQSVINWIPTDNATNTTSNIVFQNAGTTATFTSTSNFAVLNNIDSASISRAIEMNGTVRARVGGLQRGSVYFYAPGGFVFGGGSIFNVGSLVVSALPIAYDANGFITGFGTTNTVSFGQAPNPNAAIVNQGAISASVVTSGVPSSSNSSYVAMVAPSVQHSGLITVRGSAALVGAEQATMSFSPDGLFDISVTVGTDHANGVAVSGDIGGPSPTAVDNQHRVYLVAVPKNDALTMVISNGADLGFTLANNATIDQYGAVILSAGHDIVNGDIGGESAGSNAAANFWFTGAHATNNLFGEATGYADLYSTDAQASQMVTVFDSDVTVHADEHVLMNAWGEGTTLTVGGNLDLSTDDFANFGGDSAQGGLTELSAQNGGSVTVTGNATLTANGVGGGTESSGEAGGTGTGGEVNLLAHSGGSLHVLGNVELQADGIGGDSFDGNGGAGIGGAVANGGGVTVSAQGGTLTLDNLLTASASGFGGDAFQAGTTSGNGTGGNFWLSTSLGGDVLVGGETEIHAEGRGGTTWDIGANGGDGQGGIINVSPDGAGATISLTGALMSADGFGGEYGVENCCIASGGDGFGGAVNISGAGGLFESNGTVELSAAGWGGGGDAGAAGNGIGGKDNIGMGIIVHVQSGMTFDVTGDLLLDASGHGGFSVGTNAAGDGTGGSAKVHVDGGSLTVSNELGVDADGFGADSQGGGNGGNGTGGTAELVMTGGSLTVGGRLLVEADGTGGDSDNEGPLGNGGHGTGGNAGVFANGGALHVLGDLEIIANGTGGFGDTGGNGFGKWAELFASGGGTVDIDGTALISASGYGGEGDIGGAGHGGGELFDTGTGVDGAHIFAQNGSINIDGATTILADGQGGNGGTGDFESDGGAGGDATAGWAGVTAANSNSGPSSITLSTLNISSSATGGDGGQGGSGNQGGNGGAGGAATAGDVTVFANAGNGHLTVTSVAATAIGTGGRGGDGGNGDSLSGGNGGDGGDAVGGHVQVGTASGNGQAAGSNLGTATYGSIIADTSATGGDGGDGNFGSPDGTGGTGGIGDGGKSVLLVRGSTVTVNGSTQLISNGTGGDGGTGGGEIGGDGAGGDGFAGEVAVESTSRYQLPAQHGTLNAGSIVGTATGIGGLGSTNGDGIVEGGSSFLIDSSTVHIASLDFDITGDAVDPGADESFIRITNSIVRVDDTFAFSTIGDLSFYIDNGSLGTALDRVGTIDLSAAAFVADTVLDPPTNGTAFATNLLVSSEGDFIADANFDVANGIDIAVPGSIRFNNATSGTFTDLAADTGSIDVGNVNAGGYVSLVAGTSIDGGNVQAGGVIFAQSADGDINLGTLTSTFSSIIVDAAGDIDLGGDAQADGSIDLTATGDIDMQNALAGESVVLDAGSDILALNLTGGDSVDIEAGGAVDVGNLSAGLVDPSVDEGAVYDVSILAGGNILAGNISAAGNVALATPGTMTTEDINAVGTFFALGHGDMIFGDATASEVFLADFAMVEGGGGGIGGTCAGNCGTLGADGDVTAPPSGPNYFYVTTHEGAEGAGQLANDGRTESDFPTNGSLYTTSPFDAAAGDDLSFWFNYVTSDGSSVYGDYAWAALFTTGLDQVAILFTARTQPEGTIVPGANLPGVEATLTPASVPIIDGATDWSPLGTYSTACFDAGCGSTGWINSTYQIADAGSYVLQFGVTNWNDTIYHSGMAFSGITVGGTPVGGAPIRTGGSITIGNVNTGKFTAAAGTSLTTGIIDSGGGIALDAGGAITTNNLFADDFVLANGESITTQNIEANSVDMTSTGGSITTLDIDANDFVQLLAADDISTGDITAFGQINLESSNGGISTQDLLSTDGDIDLDAFGDISFASADAGTEFDFSAGGSVDGGNVVAGNQINGDAGGTVELGGLTVEGPLSEGEPFSIGIVAAGDLSVGNVAGAHGVGLGTLGDLSTGDVDAGPLFMALVGGDTTIDGAITTSGEDGGQVYIANASMCEAGGGCGDEDDFIPENVLALDPVPTGGSITINGPVETGVFRAAAGTTLTTQAVSAEDAIAFAGGLAVINGAWTVGDAKIISNDIDITTNGSISGDGDISLVSKNSTRTVVGDGLNLPGYNLSGAEFNKLSANDVTIIADTSEGAAAIMFIGSLNANAGGFPEGIDYEFVTGNGDTEVASGTIRVAGNAVFTGMTSADHSVNFTTDLFQLVTEIGSVSLFSSGSTLGGELGISADRVHVASASVLNQLASNPTYPNYQQDLNETPDVQRPEGVLRADTISIQSDNLQDVLIQNTGTGFQNGTPAGFLARQLFIDGGEGSGSINLVINGQVVSEGGTLTGVDARDALVPEGTDITAFTTNSTINGCPLTGACILAPPPPPPAANVVDNQIDLITGDPLGDSDFGNEDSIDDNEEGDEGADNPISPPQPLFDTRPLIPSGDVNDPVSGTGNPALLGSDQQCEAGEDGQCPANPVEGDSQ